MVKIRLARYGRKNGPFYRVVAIDSTKKDSGKYLEILGFWNPANKELKVKSEELKVWVGKGAQISPTVKKLLEK